MTIARKAALGMMVLWGLILMALGIEIFAEGDDYYLLKSFFTIAAGLCLVIGIPLREWLSRK